MIIFRKSTNELALFYEKGFHIVSLVSFINQKLNPHCVPRKKRFIIIFLRENM